MLYNFILTYLQLPPQRVRYALVIDYACTYLCVPIAQTPLAISTNMVTSVPCMHRAVDPNPNSVPSGPHLPRLASKLISFSSPFRSKFQFVCRRCIYHFTCGVSYHGWHHQGEVASSRTIDILLCH